MQVLYLKISGDLLYIKGLPFVLFCVQFSSFSVPIAINYFTKLSSDKTKLIQLFFFVSQLYSSTLFCNTIFFVEELKTKLHNFCEGVELMA